MNDAITITATAGIEQSTAHTVRELGDYCQNAVAYTIIIKKLTGEISLLSFDKGAGLPEKKSPFNTYILVIEGTAELLVDRKPNLVEEGMGIIIPAHTSLIIIQATQRFKIIRMVIKSGYEQ